MLRFLLFLFIQSYKLTKVHPAGSFSRRSISISFNKTPCSRYAVKLVSQNVLPLLEIHIVPAQFSKNVALGALLLLSIPSSSLLLQQNSVSPKNNKNNFFMTQKFNLKYKSFLSLPHRPIRAFQSSWLVFG